MEKVKVLIIGAGPAGSTCALLLKKQNVDCLLIDRAVFPRDKICGGGLTPRSCQLLNSLLPTFHYDYNSVNRLKLLVEGKQVFDLHMNQELRIVKRREFDAQLLQEYQNSGGAFANDALDLIEEKDGQIIVTLKSGRQVAREIGRSESFVSSSLAQGVCPRVDTLARVAHACGYELVLIPKPRAGSLTDAGTGIVIEYGGSTGSA